MFDIETFSKEINGRSSPLSVLGCWSFDQPAAGAVGEEGLPGVAAAVGSGHVWSLTRFYSVDFSQSWIGLNKVRFQQTHNQGLRQLFLLCVFLDLRP